MSLIIVFHPVCVPPSPRPRPAVKAAASAMRIPRLLTRAYTVIISIFASAFAAISISARAQVLKAPHRREIRGTKVFLAGSLETGETGDWQARVTSRLSNLPISILNPRGDNLDPGWEQVATDEQISEQVKWELDYIARADVIAMYFDPGTKASTALLEFGMCAGGRKMIVGCPQNFYRRGNVEIVCERKGIIIVDSFNEFVESIIVEVRGQKTRSSQTDNVTVIPEST